MFAFEERTPLALAHRAVDDSPHNIHVALFDCEGQTAVWKGGGDKLGQETVGRLIKN